MSVQPTSGAPAASGPGAVVTDSKRVGELGLVLTAVSGLCAGVVMGFFIGKPSDLLEQFDGPVGALIAALIAVWAMLDKWADHLEGAEWVKVGGEFFGLLVPTLAVGASIAFLATTSNDLDTAGKVFVAVVVGVLALTTAVSIAVITYRDWRRQQRLP